MDYDTAGISGLTLHDIIVCLVQLIPLLYGFHAIVAVGYQ